MGGGKITTKKFAGAGLGGCESRLKKKNGKKRGRDFSNGAIVEEETQKKQRI